MEDGRNHCSSALGARRPSRFRRAHDLPTLEHLFDTGRVASHPQSNADSEFARGYDEGWATCLTAGPETARGWLRTEALRQFAPGHAVNSATRVGYAQAVWDYEDANGLPHPRGGVTV